MPIYGRNYNNKHILLQNQDWSSERRASSQVYLLVNPFFKIICYLYSSVDCFHIWYGWRGGPVDMSCARETTLTFFVMYLSPLTSKVLCLTFFQRYMSFTELPPYLIGIKRKTSRRVECKRDNSHFLCYVLISPEVEILCMLKLKYCFRLVETYIRSSRRVACKKDNSSFVIFFLVISPERIS